MDKLTGMLKATVVARTEKLRRRTSAISCAITATLALKASSLKPSTTIHELDAATIQVRSEERRVGKECRARWTREHDKKQQRQQNDRSGREEDEVRRKQ